MAAFLARHLPFSLSKMFSSHQRCHSDRNKCPQSKNAAAKFSQAKPRDIHDNLHVQYIQISQSKPHPQKRLLLKAFGRLQFRHCLLVSARSVLVSNTHLFGHEDLVIAGRPINVLQRHVQPLVLLIGSRQGVVEVADCHQTSVGELVDDEEIGLLSVALVIETDTSGHPVLQLHAYQGSESVTVPLFHRKSTRLHKRSVRQGGCKQDKSILISTALTK